MPTIGRFRYLEAAPPSAPASRGPRGAAATGTLVLVHGFPLSARMWEGQLELANLGWRIVVPQLRGFDGPPADPVATSIDDFAGDIIDLLDALHIENAVVGGLSMGGYIAFAMFRHAPGYFRALVLADTRAPGDALEAVEGRKRMIQLVREKGPSAAADEMLPRVLGDTTRAARPDIVESVRGLIMSNSTETIVGALEALMTRPDATPVLQQIHCPTLVVVGEQDTLTPPKFSEDIKKGIAHAELVIVPDAGHMSNMEQPAAFNRALAHFLEYRV